MAAVQQKVRAVQQPSAQAKSVPVKEPIWVFESNPGAPAIRGAEEIAIKCLRAKPENGSGPAGNTYAIVTRDADNKLLPIEQLREQVQAFFVCADKHPHRDFRLVVSPFRKTDEEFAAYAQLFRKAPSNCELPGRILEELERLNKTRIIVLDANVKEVDSVERKRSLNQYFTANEGLWPYNGVEVVSYGLSHTIVHNDKYAKGRGYGHRVPTANRKIYGKHEDLARQILAISYATKMVCFSDPMGTSTGFHMQAIQFAHAAGLDIDEVLLN